MLVSSGTWELLNGIVFLSPQTGRECALDRIPVVHVLEWTDDRLTRTPIYILPTPPLRALEAERHGRLRGDVQGRLLQLPRPGRAAAHDDRCVRERQRVPFCFSLH